MPATYDFGVFHLDTTEHQLLRDGRPVSLPPKAFDLLVDLVEHAGHLREKKQLMDALWPGTFVEEVNLAYTVSALRKALGDTREKPEFIETVPTKGYRFVARVTPNGSTPAPASGLQTPGAPAESRSSRRGRRRWLIGSACVALVALGAGAWWLPRRATRPAVMRVEAVTALAGFESGPAFSPDGDEIAFSWDGAQHDNHDIYVKHVGSADVRRLTADAAIDKSPSWSPDGRTIAYVRYVPGRLFGRVRLVSVEGGGDRAVSDMLVGGTHIEWSRDGRELVVGARASDAGDDSLPEAIYALSAETGEPRRLTQPHSPSKHKAPAFSHDGRRLAYLACQSAYFFVCQIEVAVVDGTGVATHTEVVAGSGVWMGESVAWSADDRSLITSLDDGYLWRFPLGGDRPERLDIAASGAGGPAVSPIRDRLAFRRALDREEIARFHADAAPDTAIAASGSDSNFQFSPDGSRVAFCSSRAGGGLNIWTAAPDGTAPRQVTRGHGPVQCSPDWSPDGGSIAFDALADDGHFHVWTIGTDGGPARQVTRDGGDQTMPTWSADGQWLYYTWDPGTGGRDLFRVRLSGAERTRVTQGGGILARESADGRSLYYTSSDRMLDSPLLLRPVSGGTPTVLVPCVRRQAFVVRPESIYYVGCEGAMAEARLHVLDLRTSSDRVLGTLTDYSGNFPWSLAVSPRDGTILYGRVVHVGADLLMIEHFR